VKAWIGAAKFALEGVIHEIDPENKVYESWTKVKHVPTASVVARLEGCWKSEIRYRMEEDKVRTKTPNGDLIANFFSIL
jgi:hypothetical protein